MDRLVYCFSYSKCIGSLIKRRISPVSRGSTPLSCRVVNVILADYLYDDSRTGVPDRLPCD